MCCEWMEGNESKEAYRGGGNRYAEGGSIRERERESLLTLLRCDKETRKMEKRDVQ